MFKSSQAIIDRLKIIDGMRLMPPMDAPLDTQLYILHIVARRLGLYEAADWVERLNTVDNRE